MDKAGKEGCDLVAFGEALIPGYPHWVDCTDGAKSYSDGQKKIFAHYLKNSVDISGIINGFYRNENIQIPILMNRDRKFR